MNFSNELCRHTIRVYIDGIQYGEGSSHRKKDAEQQAAYLALRKLGINVRHMSWCQSGTSSVCFFLRAMCSV